MLSPDTSAKVLRRRLQAVKEESLDLGNNRDALASDRDGIEEDIIRIEFV
jgi:hypothetical protein